MPTQTAPHPGTEADLVPTDARGLEITTRSVGAAQRYNAGVEQYLEFRTELIDTLREALALDPKFVMANVLLGVMFRLGENDAMLPRARKYLEAAQACAEEVTPREQAHIEALANWLAGDIKGANRLYAAILKDTPRDLLALKLLTFNAFWLGDAPLMRDAPRDVLRHFHRDVPGYGYVLGMHAFGLEECGEYAEAERAGRAAVELNTGDLWSVHAVAHVLEMQCRLQDGLDWLQRLAPAWEGRNNFVFHLWWHRALYLFELEQWPAVLDLYDSRIRNQPTDFWIDIQNAASLLWRLELRGVPIGERWKELGKVAEQRIPDMAQPFTSLHFVMAALRSGRPEIAKRHIDAMRQYADQQRSTLAPVFGDIAVPVCEGLVAFSEGVYSRASERIMKAYGKLQALGASHAQRDVLILTLIQAARDGGYLALARDLLAARTESKAGSADAWHTYARVLELSRDLTGASVAKGRGDTITQRAKGAH
jgi:tetratricopeptide (TPR) repeat protein